MILQPLQDNLSHQLCDFSNSLSAIESYVKAIKRSNLDVEQASENKMPGFINEVIQFMASRGSYRSHLFSRSIILLDNMLALDPLVLSSVTFPKDLVENLGVFFCKNLKNEDEDQGLTYAVLYLVLLMISRVGQCSTFRKILCSNLFKTRFLKRLATLEHRKSPQITRIIPIILCFLLKIKKTFIRDPNVKTMIFSLLATKQEQLYFHLILCLKELLPTLTITDIKQQSVCSFLSQNLSTSEDPTIIKNCLSIVNILIIKHPELISTFIKDGLMISWSKFVRTNSRVCLSIFQSVIFQINPEKLQEWFIKYFNKIKKETKNEIHLQILTCLIKRVEKRVIIEAINDGILSEIIKIQKLGSDPLRVPVKNLRWSLEKALKETNYNMWAIFMQQQVFSPLHLLS